MQTRQPVKRVQPDKEYTNRQRQTERDENGSRTVTNSHTNLHVITSMTVDLKEIKTTHTNATGMQLAQPATTYAEESSANMLRSRVT